MSTKIWETIPNQIADDIERCCRDAIQNGIVQAYPALTEFEQADLDTYYDDIKRQQIMHAYPAPTGSEQAKYERMWSFEQYRTS